MVKKKDGSLRFCIDYRKVNKVTKKWVYPVPRIDDALESLRGAKYFTAIELNAEYWQVPVEANSREITAFRTHEGHFQFLRLPFGMCNSGATFQRLMDIVMAGIRGIGCLVYLDDVFIASSNWSEHIKTLEIVLNKFKEHRLTVKPTKCQFAKENMTFLGHQVTKDGINADPDKLRAIDKMPKPENVSEVRRFIGAASYYRRFIQNFAQIASTLTDLTKKDVPFK